MRMLLTVSFLSALVGVGFAGVAALLPDTGVDGTPGAFLAFAGAAAVALAIGLMLGSSVSSRVRGVLGWFAALVAILSALAAWFLMQNVLLAAMIVALVALVVSGFMSGPRNIK